MKLSVSSQRLVASCCKHGNKRSSTTKVREFTYYLATNRFVNKLYLYLFDNYNNVSKTHSHLQARVL